MRSGRSRTPEAVPGRAWWPERGGRFVGRRAREALGLPAGRRGTQHPRPLRVFSIEATERIDNQPCYSELSCDSVIQHARSSCEQRWSGTSYLDFFTFSKLAYGRRPAFRHRSIP